MGCFSVGQLRIVGCSQQRMRNGAAVILRWNGCFFTETSR